MNRHKKNDSNERILVQVKQSVNKQYKKIIRKIIFNQNHTSFNSSETLDMYMHRYSVYLISIT